MMRFFRAIGWAMFVFGAAVALFSHLHEKGMLVCVLSALIILGARE